MTEHQPQPVQISNRNPGSICTMQNIGENPAQPAPIKTTSDRNPRNPSQTFFTVAYLWNYEAKYRCKEDKVVECRRCFSHLPRDVYCSSFKSSQDLLSLLILRFEDFFYIDLNFSRLELLSRTEDCILISPLLVLATKQCVICILCISWTN